MSLQEPAKMTKPIKTYVFNKNYRGCTKTFQGFITHNDKQVHKILLLVLNLSVNNIICKCKLLFHINRSIRIDKIIPLKILSLPYLSKKLAIKKFLFSLGPFYCCHYIIFAGEFIFGHQYLNLISILTTDPYLHD